MSGYTNKLTVILRDDSPMVFANDSPSYRSVVVELTPDQMARINIRQTGTSGNQKYYESISECFIEEDVTP